MEIKMSRCSFEKLQTMTLSIFYQYSPVDSQNRLYPLSLPFLATSYFFNNSKSYIAEAGYVTSIRKLLILQNVTTSGNY